MPENLHDSPARLEEHEQYLRDPTSTGGKPYSSKQRAANEEHKRRVTLCHKTEGRQKFDASEVENAMKNGWRDTPFVHPRHPGKILDTVEPAEQEPTPEMQALLGEAKKLGIAVDKRWGQKRLQDEILKAASDG